ncbi:MAG TPA: ATP-binding cassette domain-containing protein [Nitrospirae bacterium]|nr:putative ABC transporter ATP-binding protein YheS [bacterium BMS3Abin06]HDH11578.1 ATP-binding cassette domain-containing protein [Nitrospirota bacterium]HDZ01965.1 ATP-binding cassette domain-containing protein [Nitrospirota bacterium]
MIQVSNLDKSYGQQVIFDKAGFTVNPGERVGLVGRNGHGKTTLFRMILGQEQPDSGIISIPDDYRRGHLSQHIRFTEATVLKEACLSLPAGEGGKDETYKAETILMGLGFSTDDFSLAPMDLSGGYQVRLNLAKVLVSDPDILLLDEPTNYLDIVSLRWLAQFLRSWQKELIIITHDRSFMDSVTTHTMAIHRFKIRKVAGPTEKVYQQLLLEEEIYEKTRMNNDKKRKETEQFINRFRAKATKARAVQSRIKALQKKERLEKLSEIKNLEFRFNPAPFTGRQLMEVKNLSFGFDHDGPRLINGLSFYVGKTDRIAIIGKNGKGKTTLLNLIAGELSPLHGTVRCHRHMKPAYFGQTNIVRLNLHKTVEEEIMDADPEHHRGAARNICGAMMFPGDHALKKISVLSGGEKSRVLLGKLLVSPANMLLLDEPTNHLDMESTESLLEAIDDFGGAVIIVTHSEMILHALATRLIVFDDGKVTLFEGTYQDFLDRVGWKNENEAAQSNARVAGTANRAPNKKLLRRIRAELINEKSRTLGALQKRIDKVEEEIISLEEKTGQDNRDILEASLKGDGETIKRISKAIHDSKTKIESLFSELELLHVGLESKTKAFEEKFKAIDNSV